MKIQSIVTLVFLAALVSGCVSNYRYESQGEVLTSAGERTRALLYWSVDEGGIWYHNEQATESDIALRVCGGIPKDFVPSDEDQVLEIRSRSGDQLVAKVEAEGDIAELENPKRVRVEEGICGLIEVSQEKAKIGDLVVSAKPEIVILCDNIRESDSYPQFGRYKFKAVTRTESKGNNGPTDICN
jgi:hypothetical protein